MIALISHCWVVLLAASVLLGPKCFKALSKLLLWHTFVDADTVVVADCIIYVVLYLARASANVSLLWYPVISTDLLQCYSVVFFSPKGIGHFRPVHWIVQTSLVSLEWFNIPNLFGPKFLPKLILDGLVYVLHWSSVTSNLFSSVMVRLSHLCGEFSLLKPCGLESSLFLLLSHILHCSSFQRF